MFDSYLNESILGRAIKEKKIKIRFYNPRDYVADKKGNNYKPVDDRSYGGGPGMVMKAEPILKAVERAILVASKFSSGPRSGPRPARKLSSHQNSILIINFIPSAEKFTTTFAKKVSLGHGSTGKAKKYTDIILICGRYEGIDARVDKILRQAQNKFCKFKKLSIGDYVLTGGEIPAMVLIDSIARQIPGVLGKYESLEEERISSSEVYTRPEVIKYKGKNYRVPKVLLSGHHGKIEEWKKNK